MIDTHGSGVVLNRLERVLAEGILPEDAAQTGQRLLERIKSPVRVVVLGLPGSGKSKLMNMIAGQQIIPDNVVLPTLELAWGRDTQTVLTLQDGSVETRKGPVTADISARNPAFVRFETALPILEKLSLLEVVADGSPEDQNASIRWAVRRADIAIWCSQEFTSEEYDLWSRVPDALKDHSFFVLNKADILSSQGVLSSRISQLQDVVADEFHGMFPVATLQAISASNPDGSTDEVMLNASGGKALVKAIENRVDLGRRADLDSVLLFLSRHDATSKQPARTREETVTTTGDPAPDSRPVTAKTGNAVASAGSGAKENLNSAALHYLQSRAEQLTQSVADLGAENTESILDHCVTTADHLVDMLEDEDPGSSGFDDLREDCLETAEILILLQLENNQEPAADAVTLLLQLRRGFEVGLAA